MLKQLGAINVQNAVYRLKMV